MSELGEPDDYPYDEDEDDLYRWTEDRWRSWYDAHPSAAPRPIPQLRAVVTIDPWPFL